MVVGYQETRRHRAHQQIFGGNDLSLGLTHARIQSHAARIQLPGGQIIRQVHAYSGFAVGVGDDLGIPVSCIGEVLAGHRRGFRSASAAQPHGQVHQAAVIDRQGQAGAHSGGLLAIESGQDVFRIRISQSQHGFVDDCQ